jgi:hypothetical protein
MQIKIQGLSKVRCSLLFGSHDYSHRKKPVKVV